MAMQLHYVGGIAFFRDYFLISKDAFFLSLLALTKFVSDIQEVTIRTVRPVCETIF